MVTNVFAGHADRYTTDDKGRLSNGESKCKGSASAVVCQISGQAVAQNPELVPRRGAAVSAVMKPRKRLRESASTSFKSKLKREIRALKQAKRQKLLERAKEEERERKRRDKEEKVRRKEEEKRKKQEDIERRRKDREKRLKREAEEKKKKQDEKEQRRRERQKRLRREGEEKRARAQRLHKELESRKLRLEEERCDSSDRMGKKSLHREHQHVCEAESTEMKRFNVTNSIHQHLTTPNELDKFFKSDGDTSETFIDQDISQSFSFIKEIYETWSKPGEEIHFSKSVNATSASDKSATGVDAAIANSQLSSSGEIIPPRTFGSTVQPPALLALCNSLCLPHISIGQIYTWQNTRSNIDPSTHYYPHWHQQNCTPGYKFPASYWQPQPSSSLPHLSNYQHDQSFGYHRESQPVKIAVPAQCYQQSKPLSWARPTLPKPSTPSNYPMQIDDNQATLNHGQSITAASGAKSKTNPSQNNMVKRLRLCKNPMGPASPWRDSHKILLQSVIITKPMLRKHVDGGDRDGRRSTYGINVGYESRQRGDKDGEVTGPANIGDIDVGPASSTTVVNVNNEDPPANIVTPSDKGSGPDAVGFVSPVCSDSDCIPAPSEYSPDHISTDCDKIYHAPKEAGCEERAEGECSFPVPTRLVMSSPTISARKSSSVLSDDAIHNFDKSNCFIAGQQRRTRGKGKYGVLTILDPGSQYSAGLRKGDIILSVQKLEVGGMTFEDALTMLANPLGGDGKGDRQEESADHREEKIRCVLKVARLRSLISEDESGCLVGVKCQRISADRKDEKSGAKEKANVASNPPTMKGDNAATVLVKKIPLVLDPATDNVESGDFSARELRALFLGVQIHGIGSWDKVLTDRGEVGRVLEHREAAALEIKWCHVVNTYEKWGRECAQKHWEKSWREETGGGAIHKEDGYNTYPLTDAMRARLRSAPRPASGCKCGGTDHDRVNSVRCVLYRNIRLDRGAPNVRKHTDGVDEGKTEDIATKLQCPTGNNVRHNSSEQQQIKVVENGRQRAKKRIQAELEADRIEAHFVHQMELLQVENGLAVFAPSLTAMVISAVAAMAELVDKKSRGANVGLKETRDVEDDENITVADLAAKYGSQSMVTVAEVLMYIGKTWGHLYQEPSHETFGWRANMHKIITGNEYANASIVKGTSWPSTQDFRCNPRLPGSCSFENIQYLLNKSMILRFREGCLLTALAAEARDTTPPVVASSGTSCRSGGMSDQDPSKNEHNGKANNSSNDQLMQQAEEAIILADLISTNKTGLSDEINALCVSGVLDSTSDGRFLTLGKKWWRNVDPLLLWEMKHCWGEEADKENKYLVHRTVRRKLSRNWRWDEKAWVRADTGKVEFDHKLLALARNRYAIEFQEFFDEEDGIGQFGI